MVQAADATKMLICNLNMKFNKELQSKIDRECGQEIISYPYVFAEFTNFYTESYENKNDILRLVLASHTLGLDLSKLQCFQIWGTLSAQWRCSGIMDIPKDSTKLQSMLQEGIDLYLKP